MLVNKLISKQAVSRLGVQDLDIRAIFIYHCTVVQYNI